MTSNNPYQLDVTVHDRYVRIVARGRVWGLSDWQSVFSAAARGATDHGSKRVLLDLQGLEGGQSIAEDFSLATSLFDLGFSGKKIAMVESRHNVDDSLFFETAATNRGVRLRVFTDETIALDWLNGEPGK